MTEAMIESSMIILVNGVIFGFIIGYLQILYYGYQNEMINRDTQGLAFVACGLPDCVVFIDQSLENPFI